MEVSIIDGQAFTREQWNAKRTFAIYRAGISNAEFDAQFNAGIQKPPPPPPPPPAPSYTPPSQPQQTYSPPAPTVASVSSTNETREKAKAKSGQAKTLLSGYGGMTRARKSTTEAQARSKLGLSETTKKSLLGSAG
jgi:hypothetical protein